MRYNVGVPSSTNTELQTKEVGTMKYTTFVGLDVHKDTISIAAADEKRNAEVRYLGTIPNNYEALNKLARKLGEPEELHFCYEAGPCGYGIYRFLTQRGFQCSVVAPSLIPQRPGERVKTDRRDAQKLARLLRSGELTKVWVPDEESEALRDLTRAREDAVEDLTAKRNQLTKFLLRSNIRPPYNPWTKKYRDWLSTLELKTQTQTLVLREYLQAIGEIEARIKRLEAEIENFINTTTSKQGQVIKALQALRGVGLVTAATIVAETGDLTRFDSPRQLMSYAGLVPSEHSSGSRQCRGSITKSGNNHLRRVVVEAAWQYQHCPRVGVTLRRRQEDLPARINQISWEAQHRLNLKFLHLTFKGKPSTVAAVAVARELLGFIWAIAQEVLSQQENLSQAS